MESSIFETGHTHCYEKEQKKTNLEPWEQLDNNQVSKTLEHFFLAGFLQNMVQNEYMLLSLEFWKNVTNWLVTLKIYLHDISFLFKSEDIKL